MASNYQAILDDIAAKLATVAGIGIIHKYERQVADQAKFILLFKDSTGKICGGEITRRSFTEHQRGPYYRHNQMVLKWYMGLQDAAETSILFQELCEEISAVFRGAEPETTSPWYYGNGDDPTAAPAQGESINDRMFGSVLCHCAEIAVSVTERIIA